MFVYIHDIINIIYVCLFYIFFFFFTKIPLNFGTYKTEILILLYNLFIYI